jgi:hypothetical protein
MPGTDTHEKIVLLNRLVSRSVSRAPQGFNPPTHAGSELLSIIRKKQADGFCIEFFDYEEDPDDDKERIAKNQGKNFIRCNRLEYQESASAHYYTLLVDFVDNGVRSFPVVDIVKYEGRELSGEKDERGATAAHVVIRLPKDDEYDDGTYRCAIEAAPNISRQVIETMLSRQLRRQAKMDEWSFSVTESEKGKKPQSKKYKYHPRLELFADVGRSISGLHPGGKSLSHLVFSKRSEKQSVSQATAVTHEDVYADVELRISAKQGPSDVGKLRQWVDGLKDTYEKRGFATKMYFRHVNGSHVSGAVHPSIVGATDLLMCQKEMIGVSGEARKWVDAIQPEVRDKMKALLDRDELWERAK